MIRNGLTAFVVLSCCALGYFVGLAPTVASAADIEICTSSFGSELTSELFLDEECSKPGKEGKEGKYHRYEIASEQRLTVFESSSQSFKYKGLGSEVEISCKDVGNESGKVENVVEALTRKVKGKEWVLKWSACAAKPEGCVVTEPISSKSLKTVASPGKTLSEVKFEPEAGAEFGSITLKGCKNVALNRNYAITGSLTGVVPAADESKIEFSGLGGLLVNNLAASYSGWTRAAGTEAELKGPVFIGP